MKSAGQHHADADPLYERRRTIAAVTLASTISVVLWILVVIFNVR
jgi:hypothetical protein